MRLIGEICLERGLPAIININDVLLAQQFVGRIVGLRAGEIVFDGPPSELDDAVLTRIYGEEDSTAMRRSRDEEAAEATGDAPAGTPAGARLDPAAARLPGLT